MKNAHAAGVALALTLLLAPAALPAERKAGPRQLPNQAKAAGAKSKTVRKAAATPSNVINEVLGKDFIVEANGSTTIDAVSDFNGAERVSIMAASPDAGFANNVEIYVAWSMPDLEYFGGQDAIYEFQFQYFGGGTVPVYGPEMRVVVRNFGDAPLTIHQLTAYAVRNVPAAAPAPAETTTVP